MAAKHHQTIAEMYESEAVDLERAVHHYEQAADYFRGEESISSANKCLLKVAQYAAQLMNYEKAIAIYEQVNRQIFMLNNRRVIFTAHYLSLSLGRVRVLGESTAEIQRQGVLFQGGTLQSLRRCTQRPTRDRSLPRKVPSIQ